MCEFVDPAIWPAINRRENARDADVDGGDGVLLLSSDTDSDWKVLKYVMNAFRKLGTRTERTDGSVSVADIAVDILLFAYYL